MSLNFYWRVTTPLGPLADFDLDDPRIHIAQRVTASGYGSIVWAQDPAPVLAVCKQHPNEIVAVSEAGETFTGSKLHDELFGPELEHHRHMIGEEFS